MPLLVAERQRLSDDPVGCALRQHDRSSEGKLAKPTGHLISLSSSFLPVCLLKDNPCQIKIFTPFQSTFVTSRAFWWRSLVFSRRGFNIESLVVSPGKTEGFSRMTITSSGDPESLEQITSNWPSWLMSYTPLTTPMIPSSMLKSR